MADNVAINGASGTFTAATDEIGGYHYQRVKPTFGPDGTAIDVSSSNPLPVQPLGEMLEVLQTVGMYLASLTRTIGQSFPDSSNRLRVAVDAISASLTLATVTTVGTVTTCSTVTTVNTVTNQSQLGGISAAPQIPALMSMQVDQLRQNITVS